MELPEHRERDREMGCGGIGERGGLVLHTHFPSCVLSEVALKQPLNSSTANTILNLQ